MLGVAPLVFLSVLFISADVANAQVVTSTDVANAQVCVDKHPKCKTWLAGGKCSSENIWMAKFCCDHCANVAGKLKTYDEHDENNKAKASCNPILDIGFVIDSSGSIMYQYPTEKEFVKSLAASFGIRQDGSHAGVITFASFAEISIKLSEHRHGENFNASVDKIPLMRSRTRIDRALLLAKNEFFLPENGGRAGIPKLLIFLTDGTQTAAIDARRPSTIADEMREMGITIVAIGMGEQVNFKEIVGIGGKSQAYEVKTFEELSGTNFVTKIKESACSGVSDLKRKVFDIAFLLDSSGSLRYHWGEEKDFLNSLASRFNISADGNNIGVITFSDDAVVSIKLNQYTDEKSFSAAVDRIPLMKMYTRIDKALRVAEDEFFLPSNGGRTGIPKLLILITDGEQTKTEDSEDPTVIADRLRERGIKMLVIGISPSIKPKELASIAGGESHWYEVSTFAELSGSNFEYLHIVLDALLE